MTLAGRECLAVLVEDLEVVLVTLAEDRIGGVGLPAIDGDEAVGYATVFEQLGAQLGVVATKDSGPVAVGLVGGAFSCRHLPAYPGSMVSNSSTSVPPSRSSRPKRSVVHCAKSQSKSLRGRTRPTECAAGIINLRPDRDGRIAAYDGMHVLEQISEWIIDHHLPPVGAPTQPVEAGYMANAWIRVKHPDYDTLRKILDTIGETVKIRAR